MSDYRPYPAYKDSGVEWLGEVPEHWRIIPLKWLFECLDGKRIPLNSEQRSAIKGEVPYWGSGGIVDYINKYIFDEPLLLLGEDGAPFFERDKPVAYTIEEKSWINNHIHVLRTLTTYPLKWFSNYLNCVEYRNYIDGSTRDKLTQEDMNEITVLLPHSVAEAEIIVNHIERETARIDALIAKKTRFIELLREKRQALVTQAMTQGLDPAAKMKDSGVEWLGEVPEHWEVTPLKWRATVQAGVALGKPVESSRRITLPYLRVANVQDGYLDLTEVKEMELDSRELDRFLLQKGDLLMNEGGDNDKLGRGAVWQADIAPCIHQNHVFAVRPAAHSVCPEWLGFFTQSDGAKFYFQSRAKQTTNLASISSSSIKEFFILVPPLNEQRQIIAEAKLFCSRLDSLITKTQQSLELLKERRAALITAAVTGQIDLRENDAITAFCGSVQRLSADRDSEGKYEPNTP